MSQNSPTMATVCTCEGRAETEIFFKLKLCILGLLLDVQGLSLRRLCAASGLLLGAFLGTFWGYLGPCWAILGACWGHFGGIWEHLGTITGARWSILVHLGQSWPILVHLGLLDGPRWRFPAPSWRLKKPKLIQNWIKNKSIFGFLFLPILD